MTETNSSNNNNHDHHATPRALQSILGGEETVRSFFENVWQKECKLYRQQSQEPTTSDQSPMNTLANNAFTSLLSLLEEGRERLDQQQQTQSDTDDSTSSTLLLPILFCNGESVSPRYYDNNLLHAYLNGCSIVMNHADWSSAELATLCMDLQQDFPHVYANVYITPPSSQTVSAHADDRDVFILQLLGKKHWKVYNEVPIPYPYPNEQVGKNGLQVPPQVLNGTLVYDTILCPGDVLYMPRGYVHEATTLDDDCSFHVTIAIPTQDWTLAGAITQAAQESLASLVNNRTALPVSLLTPDNDNNTSNNTGSSVHGHVELVQQQLDTALDRIRQQVTVDSIVSSLRQRIQHHNERALQHRNAIKQKQNTRRQSNESMASDGPTIGMGAASRVSLDTVVRVSTPEEKQLVVLKQNEPRGLNVREENADALLGVLQKLKATPGLSCRVSDLLSLLDDNSNGTVDTNKICKLTLLCFARCCVELGGIAVVTR